MTISEESLFLSRLPLFQDLEPSRLKLLAFTSEIINFQNGEILFKAGERGDCAYVIMEGEVDILSKADDQAVVEVLEVNQIFGEIALLNNEPRSATLRARGCLLYTSPSPRDRTRSRMPSSA